MRWYLLLVLLLASVSALVLPDINMTVTVFNSTVNVGEIVYSEVLLVNQEFTESSYSLVVTGPRQEWIANYEYAGNITSKGSKIVPILIIPTQAGYYEYDVKLKVGSIVTSESSIRFNVVGEGVEGPRSLKISLPSTSAPGAILNIGLDIQGFDPDEVEVVLLKENSEIYRLLMPVTRKTKSLSFQLPDVLLAGTYTVTVRAGQTIDSAQFTVPEIKQVEESRSIDNTLFGRSAVLRVKNKGNMIANGEIKDTLLWYERWFTRFSEIPRIGGSQVAWSYQLNPGQIFEVEYSVSFLPLVLGIIIIIMVLAYFAQESSVVLVEKIAESKDDTIGVRLKVENTGKESVGAVKVVDHIPPFSKAKFEKDPNTKLRTTEGMMVSWTIAEIGPGKSVEIKYKLKLIETIGRIHLPKAQVDYTLPTGKSKTTLSLSPYV